MGESDFEVLFYLYFIMGLSLGSAALSVLKYYYKFQFFKKRGYAFENESFFTHSIFLHFLLEFLMLCVHPSPFLRDRTYIQYNYEFKLEVTYSYNDLFVSFVIVRLLFQIFEIFQTSRYNSTRIQRINLLFNNEALSVFLPLKNYIANHPIKFMFLSFVFSIAYFSSLIIIAERPLSHVTNQNLDEWAEAIWYVVVTMATIGYGDIVAKTLVARFVVILLVIWGNFWSSIFLSSIFPYIQQSLREEKAFNHFNRLSIRKKLDKKSAELVSLMIHLNYLIGKKSVNSKKVENLNKKAARLLKSIRKTKKDMNNALQDTNYFVDDVLTRVENIVNMSENQLIKGEKIYQNVNQTLNLFTKKIKGTIAKLSSKHKYISHINIGSITNGAKSNPLGSRLKNLNTVESKEMDGDLARTPRNDNLNGLDEEDIKEHKKIFDDLKLKMGNKKVSAMNFAEDLHRYLADYLDSSLNKNGDEKED